MPTTEAAKAKVREKVWDVLDAAGAVHTATAHGRIPHFRGAEDAAERLAETTAWRTARTIKAVPDKAQLPVRARALTDSKILYMAVPALAAERPFYALDPAQLDLSDPYSAASSRTAAAIAPTVEVDALRPIDMIVLGSVACTRSGIRIGKGAGYSDIEFALLTEAGLITPETLIVTTVHSLQVVDTSIPSTDHDVNVDLIVTPAETITCPPAPRPPGILWDHLSADKIASIPALRARAARRPQA
ncbi:5-formyltetrahydrofolate cyclo-ligase [Streptomyces spectabilis]|uniref:5-formyltetrahydrofolate cyclo-ligase n=1 Tax=Streptomyces spectabilis TaxID=68270 RepID=UPI0033F43024